MKQKVIFHNILCYFSPNPPASKHNCVVLIMMSVEEDIPVFIVYRRDTQFAFDQGPLACFDL